MQQNWVSNGSTFAQGDFIGSTNGQTYLIMQSDGNLVLYTSTTSSKCGNVGGKNTGAQDTNALYQLKNIGVISGEDITTEAAITKLMFLLGQKVPSSEFKKRFETAIRGEML